MAAALYVVQPGDGWYAIARKLGTTASALLTANGLTIDTPLQPGRVLTYVEPVAVPPPPPPPTGKGNSHATLGVYPGHFETGGIDKIASIETWLGRKIRYCISNLDIRSTSAMSSSSWGVYEAPVSIKLRPDMVTATTVPLRVDETGRRTTLAGGPALIRTELTATANGAMDDLFLRIGNRAMAAGHDDAIWRLGHEADITWYPWSFLNGNGPAYVAAWRHAHDVFSSIPGNKFRFDYQGDGGWLATIDGKTAAEYAYPGDDVVDIIGVDMYDGWAWDPNALRALNYTRDMAIRHGKQMSIPEWGLYQEVNGDNPAFIHAMADWIDTLPASGPGSIAYHGYFWGHVWANLDTAPNAKAAFLERFKA
jgi:hypothetical protein